MGEDHDRRARRQAGDVVFQPLKLFFAEIAEPAGLEVHDIDETDEMDALLVETVPARPTRSLAVAVEIGLALLIVEQVMLAGDIKDGQTCLPDQLIGIVEFLVLGQVADIARVDHEAGLHRQQLDPVDRLAECRERIRIGRLVETDMAVADLKEGERCGHGFRGKRLAEAHGLWKAAAKGPEDPGARPSHAVEKAPAVNAVFIVETGHGSLRSLMRSMLGLVREKIRLQGSRPGAPAVYSKYFRASVPGVAVDREPAERQGIGCGMDWRELKMSGQWQYQVRIDLD